MDFGKSTGLMDLFQEKLCYKKLQRRKSKDLRDFLQRVTMGKKECDGISGAFFLGIVKQQVF